jgi:hypothetical protein
MSAADKSPAIIALERKILRVLCCERTDTSPPADPNARSRNGAIAELSSHKWRDAEHRIVFEALARLPSRDASELQHQLPAQATRMGFPDVQWATYFASDTPQHAQSADVRRADLEALIAQLRATATETTS